jgi:hypothetical protein
MITYSALAADAPARHAVIAQIHRFIGVPFARAVGREAVVF